MTEIDMAGYLFFVCYDEGWQLRRVNEKREVGSCD
jgi:hypothetical protein